MSSIFVILRKLKYPDAVADQLAHDVTLEPLEVAFGKCVGFGNQWYNVHLLGREAGQMSQFSSLNRTPEKHCVCGLWSLTVLTHFFFSFKAQFISKRAYRTKILEFNRKSVLITLSFNFKQR